MILRIRHLLLPLATLVVACANCVSPAIAGSVEITRLWTGYRESSSFLRLSELFTGKEQRARNAVLRSQPEERAGFYYIIRLADHDREALPNGTVVIQIVAPDGEEPETYRFPFTTDARRKIRLDVGITGRDWTYGETLPLAWKLEIVDSAGNVLAERESFLWTKPRPGDT